LPDAPVGEVIVHAGSPAAVYFSVITCAYLLPLDAITAGPPLPVT
jgi:hypothetical protein